MLIFSFSDQKIYWHVYMYKRIIARSSAQTNMSKKWENNLAKHPDQDIFKYVSTSA